MSHADDYPDTSCAVLQETTSLVTMSGVDHGSTTAAFHIVFQSQESSELSQAEPVLSWNLFCLQAAAPSHIPTPALPAPPCSVAQAIAASTTHNFYPLLFYLKLVKI